MNQILKYQELSYLFDDDEDKLYNCSDVIYSKKFSHLHKCVLITSKYSFMNDYINEFLHENPETINDQNEEGWTALMIAARNSRTFSTERTVEILLENLADPNIQSNDGLTALMLAAMNSNFDSSVKTVKLLLEYHADVNMVCFDHTALSFACNTGNEETIVELLKYKSKVNIQIGKETLISQVYNDYIHGKIDIRIVAWLILYGANLNSIPADTNLVKRLNTIDFMIEYKSKLREHIRDHQLEIQFGNCISCPNRGTKGILCESAHFTCLQCMCIRENYICSLC